MADETTSPIMDRAEFGPSNWSQKGTIEWIIHDFENLSQETGEVVEGLPTLKCHGITWGLDIYPRGQSEEYSEYVSAFIYVQGGSPEELDGTWMRHRFVHPRFITMSRPIKLIGLTSGQGLGSYKYLCREDLSTFLVDGALKIQAELQVTEGKSAPWTPKTTIGTDMWKLLKSGRSADVTFIVGGTSFPAHRHILEFRSPTLLELCEDAPPGSEVPIIEVSAAIFEAVLEHVYTDKKPPATFLAGNARELLDAADRFGCPRLKLLAEAELVRSGVNAENVVSLLLLAHSKSCALLKEAALDHIASDPSAAMDSENWGQVEESPALMAEIMKASFGKKTAAASMDEDGAEYGSMRVTTLRRKLDEAGLSGDGTREILVKRLKAHHDGTADD